ncbi:PREDICTED: uncharacterized protein LOC109330885 [Lupinus angustifolius]|uniref:uncharacterized protein LOC109330885 n=1 Tax=Lupinus angustifolius TaxID=3871 RepID=UPI00092E81E7|nr:PREDICTED: uncharacterized protein LOC109330885 [Lupinus angustifolius]
MRRRYELMQMEKSEKISEFFTRIITHTNSMKSCGEKMDDATILEKILRIVAPRFDHVVVAIEESGKVERMKRNGPRKFSQSGNDLNTEHRETFNKRDGGKHVKAWKKMIDRKRIRCFNCDKFGHFSSECQAPNRNHHYGRQESEANLVKEDDGDSGDIVVQLMMKTCNMSTGSDTWYLDSGCSNHMTGKREWLVNFDLIRKSKVKFADH